MLRTRVFLSFASEYRTLAEGIALRLKSDGLVVFMDRLSLSTGGEYDRRIRREIARCDLFIFLISPESVAPGSYCRTELALVETRWPVPGDKVLPVRVAPVLSTEIPPYLQAVTYLDPPGNVPADVAHAVESWRARRRRRNALVASVAAALLLLAVVLPQLGTQKPVELQVKPTQVLRHHASLGSGGDQFRVELDLQNESPGSITLDQVELEVKQPELAPMPSLNLDAALPVLVGPGSNRTWAFGVTFHRRLDFKPLSEQALPDLEWRVCWQAAGKRACSDWGAWKPGGNFPEEQVRRVHGELGSRARWVTQSKAGFVVALTNPNQLQRLDEQGQPKGDAVELPGYPVVLLSAGESVFVATRGRNVVEAFSADTLMPLWSHELDASAPAPTGDTALSTEPKSMAVLEGVVWLATSDRYGEARLWKLAAPEGHWEIVRESEQFGFNAEGLKLRAIGNELWAVEEVSPASLRRLGPRGFAEFKGHDITSISCASDLIAGRKEGIVLLTCDGDLAELKPLPGGTMQLLSAVPTSLEDDRGHDRWIEYLLLRTEKGVLAGLSTFRDQPSIRPFHARIARVRWGSSAELLLDEQDMVVVSLAARDGRALAITKDAKEHYGLLVLQY
jgi:hypothetical protein